MRLMSIAICFGFVLSLGSSLQAQPAGGAAKNPVVALDTSKGMIKIELYPDKAPETVKNFLHYVETKHYDGTIFHRVIPQFMIQGGGLNPGLAEKKTEGPIKNEAGNGLSNAKGSIAMARTGNPHSATAQFFINTVDNRFLDKENARDGWGYCVFGKVIDGLDVVDKIKGVPTGNVGGQSDVPKDDIIIKTARKVQ